MQALALKKSLTGSNRHGGLIVAAPNKLSNLTDLAAASRLEELETPAFVYDESILSENAKNIAEIVQGRHCKVLYTPKANAVHAILNIIAGHVDGFAASSIFEAQLSREVMAQSGSIHLTSPGLRADDISDAASLCDYISFNSLSQWQTYGLGLHTQVKCGLRVNPGMSLVRDIRYDPCRSNSKLGIPIEDLKDVYRQKPEVIEGVSGLHFHTNSESSSFSGLLATVRHLVDVVGPLLETMEWINLGGGYIFDNSDALGEFYECVDILRSDFELKVFVEPGTAMVRQACYLVGSVVDVFASGDKHVAILDTTTNHWPEVFEFQFEPDVIGDEEDGQFEYILAGSTCLAGDVFGTTYAFNKRMEIGSKVIFADAGAYSIVKANYFNGINLPSIYALTADGNLLLQKRFVYSDFVRQCGIATSD